MQTKPRSSKQNTPDVRADEPERAMEQFTDGLRRVLAVAKNKLAHKNSRRTQRKRR
jgi:hypothetical protein